MFSHPTSADLDPPMLSLRENAIDAVDAMPRRPLLKKGIIDIFMGRPLACSPQRTPGPCSSAPGAPCLASESRGTG